jgi:pimeloyl-ACP methyl ester carboxylesterase
MTNCKDLNTDKGTEMKIFREIIITQAAKTPCIKIVNDRSHGDIILIHGYGGCKEEILALGFRMAESGFNISAIDLKGHGENEDLFDMSLLDQVNSIIATLPHENKIAIGHSLGGRLALLSDANIRVGISPALKKNYSDATVRFIKNLRQYRIRESDENTNFILLEKLPEINFTKRDLILYGERDLPDIIESIRSIQINRDRIRSIRNAFHGDICFLENTFSMTENFIIEQTSEMK